MGFLFGKNKRIDSKPDYTSVQIQTSALGLPIPIVWGTNKMAGNLIWYGDFRTIAHTQKQGGKGGGGKVTTTTYTYTVSFLQALCEGPISGVARVWSGKNTYPDPSGLALTILTGLANGAQDWSYLATNHPSENLDYSNTALVGAANFDLGGSASIPNNNYEVHGLLVGTMSDQGNNYDADVGLMIQDFLTAARYGANFPSGFLDLPTLTGGAGSTSIRAYARSLAAGNVGLSPCLSSQEQASAILDRWLKLLMVAPVWTGSILKFVPFYPNNLSSTAGWSWVAPTTPIYSLTDDDYVRDGSNDPVQCSRNDIADAYNVIRYEILDRTNNYQPLVVERRDEGHINTYGLRIAPTQQAHEITDPAAASLLAWLVLQRGLTVRNTYKWKLSWEFCTLDPMDVVELTDTVLALNAQPVRITTIEEDQNFELTFTAEEFVAGVGNVAFPTQSNTPTIVTTNIAPASVYPPMIFEPPAAMTASGGPEVWMAVSGGTGGNLDPYWGGCQVWVSTDNVNFTLIGTQTGPARVGVLTAAIATYSGSAPDATHTLSVNLAQSSGTLQTVSATDAANGITNCWVGGTGGEALSFQTATLTSQYHYDLTNLYRGQGGTPVSGHSIADNVCRLDDQIFKYILPAEYVGKTLYVKLQSFNIWGNALQDLSTVTAYTYNPNGNGQSLADNWVWSHLIAGQAVDCGTAGTTIIHTADAGTAGDGASIGTVNLGNTP
jgi:hypothetical protein